MRFPRTITLWSRRGAESVPSITVTFVNAKGRWAPAACDTHASHTANVVESGPMVIIRP
jgi:hypothetical protein